MLFLLNDVVFDLDEACPVTPGDARRFEKLGFDYVLALGCELFAEDPMLHHNDPERALRLAWLVADRAPELVEPRFCALPAPVMRQLHARAAKGSLDAVAADRAVWGRLAA